MELFRKLNDAGTTIVQVTHSDVNASYGSRIIHLRDGWIVDDYENWRVGELMTGEFNPDSPIH